MSKSIALGLVGAGAVLLKAILLLMAVSSVFTLHVPVAAQGISPTATTTPALTSAPIPAPVSIAPPDATDDGSQPDGLFYEVDGEPPPSIGVDTLASRLVGIDLGQLAQVNGEVSAVTATLHRPSSVDTIVTLLASPADAVTLSGSGVLTIPAGQTVSGGTVTITGVDNGDQTGDVIVSVSATATNPSSLGVIEPEPVELAIAAAETPPVVTLSLSPSEIAEHEGLTFVTATLGNRSGTDTTVTVSATPADAVEGISSDPLTIPAGQTESNGFGVSLLAVDNDELAEATQTVTVSGTSENPQGVAGPENVTLTIIDDEAPLFAADSIAYTFTAGIAGSRFLPEAEFGNGKLTYSLSPAPSNDVTFTPEPPARIGVSATSVAAGETSYTLTATDADGDTDTMTISITVRKGVCPNSAAVSGYTDPGIVDDCEALLVSKGALGGDKSLNWSEDLSIGEWQGVELADGRVVGLLMSSDGIVGTIPSELGNLSNLQELFLNDNQLTGGIPEELGSLANLQRLSLWGNQLTGGIPEELGSLANLQRLSLWGNQLTGEIPPELGGLSNLTRLFLDNNGLTGEIPPELGGLSNLQWLSLAGNQLTGEIPPELGRLSNLQWLSLWGNQLTGEIPPELGGLSNLTGLSLRGNQLTGEIPPELGGLANLTGLFLSGNQLTGEIPPELGGLSNLTGLWLADNGLTGEIPPELGGLANLQRLYLSDNQLTGCVPPRLRDVPNNDLDQLGLPFCPLSPPEASTISSVTSEMDSITISWTPPLSDGGSDITAYDLRHIETADDETVDPNWTVVEDVWTTGSGALEYTLTGLTADTQYDIQVRAENEVGDGPWSVTNTATTVSASACVAGGAVSDTVNTGLVSDCEALLSAHDTLARTGSLNWSADTPITKWDGITVRGTPARVVWLNIRGGGLDGSVPAELGELSSLTYLNLRNNGLSGPIPTELGNLTKLTYLGLNNNILTGPIPDLSRMTRLQQLYLSNNDLSGDLPDWMGTLTEVKELWLWGNELEGPIPDLSGMIGLDRLKLQNNQFTGGIPTWFGEMTNLRYLYLHYNPLGGTIPAELGDMSRLRYLWLHNSQLTGSIPAELGRLSKLWDLNLHTNRLDGSIPAELGGMDSLQRLRLHRNMLSGQIPAELGDLENLRFMWLHGNILDGSIPAELGDLTKLERLWLSENELSGQIPVELGDLSSHSLVQWRLSGEEHHFTGCLPAGLAEVKDTDFNSLGLQVCTSTTGQPHVILRVVQVTEDWVPFSVAGGWTRAVLQKESDVLRYYEAAIWEETDSVHLYAFPNDYDGLFGLDGDVPDADVIAYREQYAISVHSDMPEMWGDRRSDFLRIAFEDFVSRLVELHPEADHHLMYSGHGGPGGNLFAGQLKHDDAGAFLATWTRLLGKPLGVIDMGGPCNKGGYEDLANFCRHASYYVASDLPNGGYTLDDWTLEKHNETDPETQYHRLLASNDTLEEALIERVELRRKRYEYSMNNQIRDQVEQANYVYSCARFNDFSEAFELFVDVTTIQAPSHDLYQLMLDYGAPPALLDRFRDVFVHGVDNRDFFEWKVTANGMLSPSSG